MKTNTGRRFGSHALTLLEVLVVIAVVFILTGLLLPSLAGRGSPARSKRIHCLSNLKQVGLAFRLWAGDNNNEFPMQMAVTNRGAMELAFSGNVLPNFQVMTNELLTPRVLLCPADKDRRPAIGFGELCTTNVSYIVGLDAGWTQPQMFLSGDSNLERDGKPVGPGILNLWSNATVGWTTDRHPRRCGNILLADGSVHMVDVKVLRKLLGKSGAATNRLAIP